MSAGNPNTAEHSDDAFREAGEWEVNNGRAMTTQFARAFVSQVSLSRTEELSLLDLGCALGDAIPVFRKAFPRARLYGCDISAVSIDRCRKDFGELAEFFVGGIDDLDRRFDAIYISNVVEHIENYIEICAELIEHWCTHLLIMVPYKELHNGKVITPELGLYHVASFDETSFDTILTDTLASSHRVFPVPGIWGESRVKSVVKKILGRPVDDRSQILFHLRRDHPTIPLPDPTG